MREHILDVATTLFLTQGYGATSIESVARHARISKRTFYHRFQDKGDLFGAVIRRFIDRWVPSFNAQLVEGGTLQDVLQRLARYILSIALLPEALALHRVIVAEAKRFPELARVLQERGAREEGITRITDLLEREIRSGHLKVDNPRFAAEQFLEMVASAPQRRALGLGTPMTPTELDHWVSFAVALFLNGCRGGLNAQDH